MVVIAGGNPSATAAVKGNTFAQQTGTTSGVVKDATGEPIIGASIMVKGTKTGTVSDLDGKFSLSGIKKGNILEVACLGYVSQEITFQGGPIDIVLSEDTTLLEDVVVIGYGTAKRKDFTGSVSSLKVETSPISMTNNTSALEALKGTVTGLDIGATTSAGGTPSMLIRGQNSISGSNEPLIVVDDVIFMGSLKDINPNDIASYDVLKDATSAAAYGSRSANGVIIITTKKGKSGKPVIRFNTAGSFQTWARKPQLMNGEQWLDAVQQAFNYNDDSFLTDQERLNRSKGIEYNWFDEITRLGFMQDNQASVSGASDKVNYYMSLSYTNDKGTIIGDDYNRISALVKLSSDITKWLQIGTDVAYTRSDFSGNAASVSSAAIMTPYGMKYRPNGELEATPDGSRGHSNPLWNTQEDKFENLDITNSFRTKAFAYVKCPWIDGLTYRMNFSGGFTYAEGASFSHESGFYLNGAYDDDNRYSVATQAQFLSSAGGSMSETKSTNWVLDNILNYNKSFGKHSIDLTTVATRDLSRAESKSMSGSNFKDNGNTTLGIWGLPFATKTSISQSVWQRTNVGYFGRANYSYDDTYYFTASYRRDGASVFGANNKWGNFFAFGGAWRISNEPFMQHITWLDDLKLKLSWGRNGNQGLSQYSTLSKMTNGTTGAIVYTFGNSGTESFGINQSSIGNKSLGWETTEAWNYGFESDMLNRRLSVNFDGYFSRTYDQIFSRTIPVMSGFASMYSSMGEVRNWGLESTIRSVNVQTRDWNWTTTLTFWLNRNKLVHLYGEDLDGDGKEDDDLGNSLFIGKSIHSIFGYEQDGIVQTSDTEYMAANSVSAGTPKYVDQNGDGKINADDRKILGCTDPSFKLHFSSTLEYKNWQLYMMFSGVFGGSRYFLKSNRPAYITSYERGQNASNGLYVPYWTESNPSNEYPSPKFSGDGYFLGLQSRSYLRLQDITLSYSFDKIPAISQFGIKELKSFITGKNLFTITKWIGGDPENGSYYNDWPIMKSVSVGASIAF